MLVTLFGSVAVHVPTHELGCHYNGPNIPNLDLVVIAIWRSLLLLRVYTGGATHQKRPASKYLPNMPERLRLRGAILNTPHYQ